MGRATTAHQAAQPQTWMKFKSLLDKECFWALEIGHAEYGIDGAVWILEGKRENQYHAIRRWMPKPGGFREACAYLLELSELPIKDRESY